MNALIKYPGAKWKLAENLCKQLGIDYYIKDTLQQEMRKKYKYFYKLTELKTNEVIFAKFDTYFDSSDVPKFLNLENYSACQISKEEFDIGVENYVKEHPDGIC